jgi:hypothetical protein
MNHKNLFKLISLLIFLSAYTNNTKPQNIKNNVSQGEKQINTFEADSSNIKLFKKIIEYSKKEKLSEKTIPEIEISIAHYFLSTPYVAKTLEKEGNEHLIINLKELDCTTFVENVVSLSNCIKNKTTNFENFCKVLTKFRYRNGKIISYPYRLHYFSDWLLDNEKKHLISIVSNKFGIKTFDSTVNYMSTHALNYIQLKNDKFVKEIAEIEKEISQAQLKFVPKEKIYEIEKHIQNGDIIAITTTIKGLDIAHVGIAYFVNKRLHLFHASSSQKKVVISEKTLQDYLKGQTKNNGIIVARLY